MYIAHQCPPGVFRETSVKEDLQIPVLIPWAQVDVLAAFLDDAEGSGLSDESFAALMD